MRVLGLDPGLRHTGWGVVEVVGTQTRYVACGTVHSADGVPMADRLLAIFTGLQEVLRRHAPSEAAVEETVVNVNAGTSLKLGHARGVVVLVAAQAGLAVSEYGAKRVKQAVTGTGAATKEQVAHMVRLLLPGVVATGHDATDALAVALCHAHSCGTGRRIAMAVAAAAVRA